MIVYSDNLRFFFFFLTPIDFVSTLWNQLSEAILLSTDHIGFASNHILWVLIVITLGW